MTMQEPLGETRPTIDTMNWLQDQVGQLRAQVGRLAQQGDQAQAAVLDINEKLRDAETRLREVGARTIGLPTMQEQLRQVSGLLERIQDAEVLIDTKFEMLGEQRGPHPRAGREERRLPSSGTSSAAPRDRRAAGHGRRFDAPVREDLAPACGHEPAAGSGRDRPQLGHHPHRAGTGTEAAVHTLRREDDVGRARAPRAEWQAGSNGAARATGGVPPASAHRRAGGCCVPSASVSKTTSRVEESPKTHQTRRGVPPRS
jgi:hypothetical protein